MKNKKPLPILSIIWMAGALAHTDCCSAQIVAPKIPTQSDANKLFNLQLEIPDTATSGYPIVAKINFKNVSNQPLFFPDSNPDINYRFTVKDSVGNEVGRTKYGVNTSFAAIFRSKVSSLTPSSSLHFKFTLSRIYDMTKSGFYSVYVTRNAYHPKTNQLIEISSDTISVQVLEPTKNQSIILPDIESTQRANEVPSKLWKVGDTWKTIVEVFKTPSEMAASEPIPFASGLGVVPKDPVNIYYTYPMTIKVVSVEKDGTKNQATVEFTPAEDSPSYVSGRSVQVVVDRETNQLLEVKPQDLKPSNLLEKLGEKLVIVRPINGYAVGFPCDIIPISSLPQGESSTQLTSPDKLMSLSVSKTTAGEDELQSEKLTVLDKDWFRVTQKWPKGQKWWSQYVKEDFDTQIGMRVTTIGSSDVTFGAPNNGLQLGLGSEDALAFGGSAVHLRVALRNSLDKDVTLKPVLMGSNLNLTVMSAAQRAVPLTIAGKEAAAKPDLLFDRQVLPAHSTIYRDLLLSRNYDLSLSDAYSVSASASQVVEGTDSRLIAPNLKLRIVR